MKTIVVSFALVALAFASPLKERPSTNRTYLPEEEDPLRIKYLLFQDERGVLHFEDLTREVPEIKVAPDDVTLYLYTINDPDDGIPIRVDELGDLTNSRLYDPKKDNYFIVHGWQNDHSSDVNILLKTVILEKSSDSNVFVVDWGEIANRDYVSARLSVTKIGELVGDFINSMMDHYEISPKMFKLIGHSLGAHVAGCIGDQVNGLVDYISGLDPAGPLYTVGNTENRLDQNDADFVHVVHTSSMLGFGSSIGHADYYPNGGSSQAGCGLDLVGSCAHSRSYIYYEESIRLGGFSGTQCNNYGSYQQGECEDNHVSYLGTLNVDRSASGDYYLYTNKKSPFSMD